MPGKYVTSQFAEPLEAAGLAGHDPAIGHQCGVGAGEVRRCLVGAAEREEAFGELFVDVRVGVAGGVQVGAEGLLQG